MTPRIILITVTVIFVGALAAAVFTNKAAPASPVAITQSVSTASSTQPSHYTMGDVAKHDSRSSCWTAINGSVYDVTRWIDQHPGGADAILSLCGIDGSGAFNAQHGGQRRPASELAAFQIGSLAQ